MCIGEGGSGMISNVCTRIGALIDASEIESVSIDEFARNAEQAGIPDIFIRLNQNIRYQSALDLIRSLRSSVALPVTVEFDSASVEEACGCIESGADRIVVSTSALCDPSVISRISNEVGRASVVVAVDSKRMQGRNVVLTSEGTPTGLPVLGWLGRAFQMGADGIVLRGDGSRDTQLISQIAQEFPASLATTIESASPRWCSVLARAGCSEIYVNTVGKSPVATVGEWKECMDMYAAALPGEEVASAIG